MTPDIASDTACQVTPDRMRRAWRVVTWAGLLGSTYYLLCITGAPLVKYLTVLGATATDFGVISGLGSLVLAWQLAGSMLSNRLRHRKPLWMALNVLHRVLYLGVLAAPFLFLEPRYRIVWIIVVLFLHDTLVQFSAPMWWSWMADLVPRESMNRHWAARQRFITYANIAVMAVMAFGFDHFERAGLVVEGFCVLAGIGVVLGVTDILLFFRVPEPANEVMEQVDWRAAFVQPIRDREFRRYLVFACYWQFAVATAAPFFSLYLVDFLGYSVRTVQLLGAASALGIALSSRFWGLLCDTYGFRQVLRVLSFCKFFAPFAYLVVPQSPALGIPILAAANFLDGVMNSGMQLAMQGVLLKSTPRKNRAMYIAAANFLSLGLIAGTAPMLAGGFIDWANALPAVVLGPYRLVGYHGAFAVSVVLRMGSTLLAARIHEPRTVPLSDILRQVRRFDVYRVVQMVYRLHESKSEGERAQTALQLGELGNPLAIGELVQALEDPSCSVREVAAEALGRIGVAEAAGPLGRALYDPDSGIQSPAARALGDIGGADSLRALLAHLQNGGAQALAETIDALARIGDETAVLPLICLFDQVDDPALRRQIADALGRLTETPSTDDVMKLLASTTPAGERYVP